MGQNLSTVQPLNKGNDASSLSVIEKDITLPINSLYQPETSDVERKAFRNLCLCSKRTINNDKNYMEFHFLKDLKSIEYISKSKVVFIMRGPSGVGKSTLASCIAEMYENSVICSADAFFSKDGSYNFDPGLLKEAHNHCKQSSVEAALAEIPIIVIDNTNIQMREMKFYLNLAKKFNYISIVVEPKTPWTNDAKMLVQYSTHNVPEETIAKKINLMKPLHPIYFGWFANESDSLMLLQMARCWLSRMLDHKDVHQEFAYHTNLSNCEDMLHYYDGHFSLNCNRLLHCTSKYTANKNLPDNNDYINHPVIKEAVGSVHRLTVIGYVVTPRTVSARVRLTKKQLTLWANDGPTFHNTEYVRYNKRNSNDIFHGPTSASYIQIPKYEYNEMSLSSLATLAVLPSDPTENRFQPTVGEGSKAHFTLGTSGDIRPVAAGFDLLNVINMESDESIASSIHYVPGAIVKIYPKGSFVIYPDKKAELDTLFGYFL